MNDTHVNESILSEEILEDQKKNRIDHMTYLPGMEDIGSEIMDQVIEAMEAYDYSKYTAADEGDKKTFWKQCLYVHTDLYCKLL